MENETMLNAEDLGFDADDLKEAGLDNQEPATPASKAQAKESEPKMEIEPKEPEDHSAGVI